MQEDEANTTGTDEPKSFARLEAMRAIEVEVQARWDAAKVYEANASDEPDAETWMSTFPYPYQNGRLHLGHTFTISKAEFATRFARMQGKHVLFPFGYHATGMPILASANKIRDEIAKYGNPPVFPVAEEADAAPADAKKDEVVVGGRSGGAKGKAASKKSKHVFQWQIMESMGVDPAEIPKFVDPVYWLRYFPPHTKADLQGFGACVDWRRSFITTEVNAYFDSFVRWQFTRLREAKLIDFGEREAVYSRKDGQACSDHARASGEGKKPQEYSLIKMRLLADPLPAAMQQACEGKSVFLVAGTLRPETMYGQTNCWVLPTGTYGVYASAVADEVYVCGEWAAINLAYQKQLAVFEEHEPLCTVQGSDLLGLPVSSPMCTFERIYVLPLLSIKMDKATGVVTSVPSDAPDDWAGLRDLREKPALRAKFGLEDHMVLPFEPVSIIETPEWGNLAALRACDHFKVTSQNDRDQLLEAKKAVYRSGFNDGVMLVGEHKDCKVSDAKPKLRQHLYDTKQAIPYFEPEAKVVSRSGDVCIVALTPQWFIDYGTEWWKAETRAHFDASVNCYDPAARNMMISGLEWVGLWGASRKFGLGTKVPWDPQYVIESLSDSTIYMAFYTVAHLLLGGDPYGESAGPAGVTVEQMTMEVWDYLFRGGDFPADTTIAKETLEQMRAEFLHWYPVNLRVSGKDLTSNHLSFYLYNHVALLGKEMAPQGIRVNGHVMLDGAKMSKSTGNFLTLSDGVNRYSADAMRFTLAGAGDGVDDANFETKTADSTLLDFYAFITWLKRDLVPVFDQMREEVVVCEGSVYDVSLTAMADRVFQSMINACIRDTHAAMEATAYREAMQVAWGGMQRARTFYTNFLPDLTTWNRSLATRFVEVQVLLLAPVCPHWPEHVWHDVLGREGFIVCQPYPAAGPVEASALAVYKHVEDVLHEWRVKFNRLKTKDTVSAMDVFVAQEWPAWREAVHTKLRELFEEGSSSFPDKRVVFATLGKLPGCGSKAMKKTLGRTVPMLMKRTEDQGVHVLSTELPFDELSLFQRLIPVIQGQFQMKEVRVWAVGQEGVPKSRAADMAEPKAPKAEWS